LDTRIQLALYVPHSVSAQLETVRGLLDPVQAGLSPAHVTLCREGEIAAIEPAVFRARLASIKARSITLHFGQPEPFHGHGILLPCVAGEEEFQALRQWILGSDRVSTQTPHITLAHPRNPKSPNNNLSNAGRLPNELAFTFTSICRIQQEGSAPWWVLERYPLASVERSA
jgi:2'-5' RNA ligase